MADQIDQHQNELEPAECIRLIAEAGAAFHVGRVAVISTEGRVSIYPVGFVVDGDFVLFRTHDGEIADFVRREGKLTLEVDERNTTTWVGWSVVVRGSAEFITDPDVVWKLNQIPIQPWGGKHHWVRLSLDDISGRRIMWPNGPR